MRNVPLTMLFLLMPIAASASGEKPVATETRELPPFSSVVLDGQGSVRIRRGAQAVKLTVDADLLDRFEARVEGGTLYLGFKCGGLRGLWALRDLRTCEVEIAAPELRGIAVNGAGEVLADGFGFGSLKVEATGASAVELRGSADALDLSCTGSCSIRAKELAARSLKASMTGAARVEVRVEDSLEASIAGAGELLYWGSPRVSQRISGAGSLRRAGE